MIKICFLPLLLLAAPSADSQAIPPATGGPYTLTKQAVAGGGARATGGAYVLTGTLAQAIAGPANGGIYALSGGFHSATAQTNQPENIFANGFEN